MITRPPRALVWASALPSLAVALLLVFPAPAAARSKPGPVTIRGTVSAVSHDEFTFVSPSKGSFTVHYSDLTEFLEKSKHVKPRLVTVGTHVGVRGYLNHRSFRAIRVTIYVTKSKTPPKETTLRGYVLTVGRNVLVAREGSRTYRFTLAPGAKVVYRNRPVKLARGRRGERVDVRYYRANGKLLATRVLLLVIQVHHPRARTIYGIVATVWPRGFALETIHGHRLRIRSAEHVHVDEQVSVRAYRSQHRYVAERVHHLAHLPVHSELIRGRLVSTTKSECRLRDGSRTLAFRLFPETRVSRGSLPGQIGSLSRGQYVSIRFWWLGKDRIADSIHVYAQPPVPRATGAIRGQIVRVHDGQVTIQSGPTTIAVSVSATTRIRSGRRHETLGYLSTGQKVLARYYRTNGSEIATSIYVYVTRAAAHTYTVVVFAVKREVRVLERGRVFVLKLDSSSQSSGQKGGVGSLKDLAVGQHLRVIGTTKRGIMQASRVAIAPSVATPAGTPAVTFRGSIYRVHGHRVVLDVVGAGHVTLERSPATTVVVDKRDVPAHWLFAGPEASVSVNPRLHEHPTLTYVQFRPPLHSLSATILARRNHRLRVADRRGHQEEVDITLATITDGSQSIASRSLSRGDFVRVRAFRLPSGEEAALTIEVAHPTVRESGTVVRVRSERITITRSSGAKVVLHVSSHLEIPARPTGQLFHGSQVPLGARLSIRGVLEAGWVRVSSATLTLRSELIHATVDSILASHRVRVTPTTGAGRLIVHIARTTVITVGREPAEFSTLERTDQLSIRSYPYAGGGLFATRIDIERPSETRTGYIATVGKHTLELTLRDGTQVTVGLATWTQVLVGSVPKTTRSLVAGEKIKVSGHLAPDGVLGASRITVES